MAQNANDENGERTLLLPCLDDGQIPLIERFFWAAEQTSMSGL